MSLSHSRFASKRWIRLIIHGPGAQRIPGALVHGLRRTYATELASSDGSVYTPTARPRIHDHFTTLRIGGGTETRSAACARAVVGMCHGGFHPGVLTGPQVSVFSWAIELSGLLLVLNNPHEACGSGYFSQSHCVS
jgi:hypothetical protein